MSLPATTWVKSDAPRARFSPQTAWRPFSVVRDPGEAPKPGDRVRAAMRLRHFSRRTDEAHLAWMHRFWESCGRRPPGELGPGAVTAFLSTLPRKGRVAASTQNQALAELPLFFREVRGRELPGLDGLVRAKVPKRLPGVMSWTEVRAVLACMDGVPRLTAPLMYGAGLRLLEVCRLRVKGIDLERNQLVVRQGKGDKDRVTMLPAITRPALVARVERVRVQHARDLPAGAGWVHLPGALARKLPNAAREWPWQWVFPATRNYVERPRGERRRHHLHETVIQQAVGRAALAAGLQKRVTCHTFRHSFAMHLLEDGSDIRTVQKLPGHAELSTTMVYNHVLNRGPAGVRSPAERLLGGGELGAH